MPDSFVYTTDDVLRMLDGLLERGNADRTTGEGWSAFFADRTDLEVAGEANATYGDVAKVIDAATTAGFVDWKITEPGRLTAPPSL